MAAGLPRASTRPTGRARAREGYARVAPRMPGVQLPPGPVVETGRQGQPRVAEQALQPGGGPRPRPAAGRAAHGTRCRGAAAGPACPPRPATAAACARLRTPKPAARRAGCRHRRTPSARPGAASGPSTRVRAAGAQEAPPAAARDHGRIRPSTPSLRSRGRSLHRATRAAGRPASGPPGRGQPQGQVAAGPWCGHRSCPVRHPAVYVFQFAAARRASSSLTQPYRSMVVCT